MLIAVTFGQFAFLAFPVALIAGIVFGIPIAMVLRNQGWTAWWHSLAGGIACSLPLIVYYIGMNPGHTSHVGLYNSMYAISMGTAGGLVFWLLAVFRNPQFSPIQTAWPLSLLLVPVILIAMHQYRGALEPKYLYGCITAYEEIDNPTAWQYSRVSIETDEGVIADATMTQGYSNPDVVGNCAWISKKRTVSLQGYRYSLHSSDAKGCQNACPNGAAGEH